MRLKPSNGLTTAFRHICTGRDPLRKPSRIHLTDRQLRYSGHWKNLEMYPGSGAYHGTDLEMVFGNSGEVSGIPPLKAEQETTRLMQHAWATFADDPWEGLSKLGWPRFDQSSATLAEIARDNMPRIRLVKPSVYDAQCSSITLGSLT